MPIQTPQQVLGLLQKKQYAPVYFLQGDEPYYIDLITNYLENEVLEEGMKIFNLTVLYGKEHSMAQAIRQAKQFPVATDLQVVIIKEAQDLQDLTRDASQTALIDYLKAPSKHTMLVIAYKYKTLPANTKLSKALSEHAILINAKRLYDSQLPTWIKAYVIEKELQITEKAVSMLQEFIGNDLNRLTKELDKVALNLLPNACITDHMIQEYVGINKQFNIFELQNAIAERNVYKANQIIFYLRSNINSQVVLSFISLLATFFSKLLTLSHAPDKSPQTLSQILQINAYFVPQYIAATKQYSVQKTMENIRYLQQADMQMKGVACPFSASIPFVILWQVHNLEKSPTSHFYKGLALYESQQYEASRHHMDLYLLEVTSNHPTSEEAIEAQYYAALCATKLDRVDGAIRLKKFIEIHPHHPKVALAYYELGNLHYHQEDYAKSLIYYAAVNTQGLTSSLQEELQYRQAYAYLNEKNFEQALIGFNLLKNKNTPYTPASNYYAGYLALKNGTYEVALADLRQAAHHQAYTHVVPYLMMEVFYHQKRFQDAINYANELKSKQDLLKNYEDIELFTAESYFFLKNYVLAARHYENYIHLYPTSTREIRYRLAYSLYHASENQKSLKYLKEIALHDDLLAQLASYYIGCIYIKTKQPNLALTAFEQASNMHFEPKIQAEAAFQHAQLNYKLGKFSAAVEALQQFKNTYPTSPHIAVVDQLLSQSYLHTSHYDLAISHIEKLQEKSSTILQVYQKATFYKGNACFNQEKYDQAITWLKKSLTHALDSQVVVQTHLWLAESYAAQQAYQQAIPHYQQVVASIDKKETSYYQDAVYGLGYAFFNLGKYTEALPIFLQYAQPSNTGNSTWKADALVRIADCYYVTKEYHKALNLYAAADRKYVAHSLYQTSLIYSILGKFEEAKKSLETLIKSHPTPTVYYEKALYEHGYLALQHQDYTTAVESFSNFIKQRPHSVLMPDAFLNRAIAQANLKRYAEAEEDYKKLLKDYPTHPNTKSALLELPKLASQQGKTDKLAQYVDAYKAANPNSQALINLRFEAAKNLFYSQQYKPAIAQFNDFLNDYTHSSFTDEANFLIAESYYRLADDQQALIQYKVAKKNPKSPFYNRILLRIANITYKQADYAEALTHYLQLKENASNKKENYYALEGMMKTNEMLQHYEAASQAASQIIHQGNITVNAVSQAALYLGKIALKQAKYQEALLRFNKIIQGDEQDLYAAEAQYLMAWTQYQIGDFKESLASLFKLNSQFTDHTEWVQQGFLLMADNYIALQELFQAKATLQSIIDHAGDTTFMEAARQKYQQLMQKIAADSLAQTTITPVPPLQEEQPELILEKTSIGEQQQTQGTIKEAEFIIKKERQHQLPEANRLIKKAPLPPVAHPTDIQLSYQLQDLPFVWQILNHKIKILKARKDLPAPLYGNCIKLGHGNYYMPYLMACLNNTSNKQYGYGLCMNYISEGRKKYAEAYHQEVSLHGTKVTEAWQLSGSLSYLGDKYPLRELITNNYHLYHDPNTYQKYHQMQFGIYVHNHTFTPLQYRINLQAGHIRSATTSTYESQEECNLQATYTLNAIFQLQTALDMYLSQCQHQGITTHQNVVNFAPVLAINYNAFLLQVGTTVAYQNDIRHLSEALHAYPNLKLSYKVNQTHRPYIGLKGQMHVHSWQEMITQNPWLIAKADIRPTEQRYILYAGLQSDWANQFTSHAGLSVSKQKNWPCFINHAIEPRNFDITYDPAATMVHVFAEMTKSSFEEALMSRVKASYFKYYLTHLQAPWHQPTYVFECLNTYNFHEKIRFKANLHCLGGMKAFDPIKKTTASLPHIVTIDLGVEYVWNQRFALFLDCQNLLAKANAQDTMTLFFPEITLQMINEINQGTLISHLGIEYTNITSDALIAKMPVDHRTKQPMGLLHGGASVALAETVGSMAANLMIDRTKYYGVGLEINANHLRKATGGYVYAEAKPLHIGKSTHLKAYDVPYTTRLNVLLMEQIPFAGLFLANHAICASIKSTDGKKDCSHHIQKTPIGRYTLITIYMLNLRPVGKLVEQIKFIALLPLLFSSCDLFFRASSKTPQLKEQLVCSLPQSNAKKIIFVLNGLWQTEEIYHDNILNLLKESFQIKALPIKIVNLIENDTSKKSIQEQAQEAYEAIKEQVRHATYEIILVGHSQGGLRGAKILALNAEVARNKSINKDAEMPLDIRGLVTLATPWEGAPVASITKDKIQALLNESSVQHLLSGIQVFYYNIKEYLNGIIEEIFVKKFPTYEPGVQDMVPKSSFLTEIATYLNRNTTPILSLAGVYTEAKQLIYDEKFIQYFPIPANLFNHIYTIMVNQGTQGYAHDMVIPLPSQRADHISTSSAFKRHTITGAIHDMLPSMLIPRNQLIYTHEEAIQSIVNFTIRHCGFGNKGKAHPSP
eukprot:gene581-726_t